MKQTGNFKENKMNFLRSAAGVEKISQILLTSAHHYYLLIFVFAPIPSNTLLLWKITFYLRAK